MTDDLPRFLDESEQFPGLLLNSVLAFTPHAAPFLTSGPGAAALHH